MSALTFCSSHAVILNGLHLIESLVSYFLSLKSAVPQTCDHNQRFSQTVSVLASFL